MQKSIYQTIKNKATTTKEPTTEELNGAEII